MRVLVAEDDQLTAELIAALLRTERHSPTIARDGIRAMMLVMREPRPELVMLDIQMPGGTGIDVLRRLKQSSKTSGIPILVVSGSDDPNAPEQMRQLGADGYVPKPFTAEGLLAEVARVVKKDA